MKVKFYFETSHDCKSKRCHDVDIAQLGYDEEEWRALTNDQKSEEAELNWNGLGIVSIWYEESE